MRALRVAEERFTLRLPVHALCDDRPAHLGLQLVGDDTLSDLVDMARGVIRELRHAPGELGNPAREVRLALSLRGYGFTQGSTSAAVS